MPGGCAGTGLCLQTSPRAFFPIDALARTDGSHPAEHHRLRWALHLQDLHEPPATACSYTACQSRESLLACRHPEAFVQHLSHISTDSWLTCHFESCHLSCLSKHQVWRAHGPLQHTGSSHAANQCSAEWKDSEDACRIIYPASA